MGLPQPQEVIASPVQALRFDDADVIVILQTYLEQQ